MRYYIDYLRIIDNNIKVIGWVLPSHITSVVKFRVVDSKNKDVDFTVQRVERKDLIQVYLDGMEVVNSNFGFELLFPLIDNEIYKFYIITEERTVKEILSKNIVLNFNNQNKNVKNILKRKKQYLANLLQVDSLIRGFKILKKYGFNAFIKKLRVKIYSLKTDLDYNEWYKSIKVTDKELERQKKEYKNDFTYLPKYSIIIPIYNTKISFLSKLMLSIKNQTYYNFEVIICDATDYNAKNNNPKEFINSLQKDDETFFNKIVYKQIKNNTIAENTNCGVEVATGDYIVLVDHDDELTFNCLYELTKVINNDSEAYFIYSDEDKVDMSDSYYFEPHFKSDFNLDMLTSVNYICHISCIKRSLVCELINKYNCFERKEYNGAQDYDLFLRIINLLQEKNKLDKIYHIDKVLYHWRCHNASTSYKVNTKTYAIDSGVNALYDYYNNSKLNYPKVKFITQGIKEGFYRTIFDEKDYGLLSILVPNKDHIKDLDKLLHSLNKSTYKNFEVIVVENNSTEKETFEYYKNIKNEFSFNIDIVKYDGIFNYSKINNFGIKYCNGDYILFLNNDIEMIDVNSLKEMMDYIIRDNVGAVGAKLLYDDNGIQHAGIIIGIGGIASHAFKNVFDLQSSYMNRAQIVQDLSAVTAACLLSKKELINEISGFDENFAVAFNDVDLCLRIRQKNKLIVYNPYATFYHYESKSRGYEDTKEKVDRFNCEVARFVKKWKNIIDDGDIYYNKNLTLMKEDFSLKDLNYEEIGKPFKMDKEIYMIMEKL